MVLSSSLGARKQAEKVASHQTPGMEGNYWLVLWAKGARTERPQPDRSLQKSEEKAGIRGGTPHLVALSHLSRDPGGTGTAIGPMSPVVPIKPEAGDMGALRNPLATFCLF